MKRTDSRTGRWMRVAAIAVVALLPVACGRGAGPGPAAASAAAKAESLSVQDVTIPHRAVVGQEFAVSFDLVATRARDRVAVTLELVPFDPATGSLDAVDPRSPDYRPYEVQGTTVEEMAGPGPESRRVSIDVTVPESIPAGAYAAVLRLDKHEYFGGGAGVGAGSRGRRGGAFAVASHTVEVVVPDLPNLRVVDLRPRSQSFLTLRAPGVGPAAEGAPESGEMEREGDISVAVVLESRSFPVSQAVRLAFSLGVPDAVGVNTWYPLWVLDRENQVPGIEAEADYVVRPDAESGITIPAGGRVGATVELQVDAAAVDALAEREQDVVCTVRVVADPENAIPEFEDDSTDNAAQAAIVHLGSALPDDPVGIGGEQAPPQGGEDLPAGAQAILAGPHFSRDTRYRFTAYQPGKGETFGDRDCLAAAYSLGALLSYDYSGFKVLGDGDKVWLRQAVDSGDYYRARNGGNTTVDSNAAIGGWEVFTLVILGRDESSYTVAFRASNGVNYLRAGPDRTTWVSTTTAYRVDAKGTIPAGSCVFTLTDKNGDELVTGDPIALNASGSRMADDSVGISYGTSSAGTFQIGTADTSAQPRKAKFLTDNSIRMWVFDWQIPILNANAAAEVDSEDIARSYFDYEVRIAGTKIWGQPYALGTAGDDMVVTTLWDSGDRFVKSEEKKARTNVWIGPVPISVEAGARGSLGIQGAVTVQVDNRLVAEAGPFFEFKAFSRVFIDVGFARAGVGGQLTLLRVDMTFRSELQLFVGDFPARLALSGPLTVSTMNGRIYVFAEWDLIFTDGRAEWDIASWRGWTKTWDWFPPQTFQW